MTWYLADYGADVIWIEPPGGDPSREEYAVRYSVYGRNKRSMVLDLKDPAGRDGLLDLLDTADVFVTSWRPGVAERLGLGYDEVHDRVPGLVYCSISGFGPGRADSDLPGYEELVHAASGAMGAQPGHREPPIFLGLPVASAGAAYMGLIGVLAALYRREDDGHGRHVETSLLDGIIAYLAQGWGYSEKMLSGPPMMLGGARFVARTFRCSDDEWLGVCTFGRGAFDRFIKAMGLEDKVAPSQPGADIMVPLTPEESQVINVGLPDTFATQPRKVWMERLLEADIAAIPVLHQCEVFDEPQAVHNQMVVEVDDPALGRVQQVAPAIRFRDTPAAAPQPAPTVDQHGEQLRTELAGRAVGPRVTGSPDERPLLEGVRLLDLGHWFAAPFSGRLLADFGAEVIKLEPPFGDGMRGFERAFAAAAAGKRSIAADIKAPQLEELRTRLIDWADVVMHNLRPGVAERLGLGYDDVRARKPDIIYFNAPGWGSSGPDTLRQSFAPLMSGYCGAAFEIGGQFNPPIGPMTNEDTGAGMLGAVALLMALVHRKRTGNGQFFELPQLNSAMTDMAHIVRRSDGTVLGADTLDPLQMGTSPLRRLYQTSDGWVCIVATSDAHVAALGQVLEVDLLADARFASGRLRADNAYLLEHLLMERFAGCTTAELLGKLRSAGVPAAEPTLNANIPTMDDPLNERLGRVAELQHPRYGRVREPAVMLRVTDTDIPPHRRAPELGEQSDEILGWAGYDAAAIGELRGAGVVR
jgi:crotonobetainyl-CoA:carnitine CoA-transferase CaiB-like acyl-CoA transferase